MAPYVHGIVSSFWEAEENLTRDLRRQQRRFKQSVPAFLRDASVSNLLTTPLVYSLGLPLLLLDLWVTLYQWVCFPIYGVACVPRRSYFFIDRHTLAYLNAIEKANCMYCSYATGVIAYVGEVTARTEHYWCPIKHARPVRAPHSHYHRFFDYGDAEGYRLHLPALSRTLYRPRRLAPVRTTRPKG